MLNGMYTYVEALMLNDYIQEHRNSADLSLDQFIVAARNNKRDKYLTGQIEYFKHFVATCKFLQSQIRHKLLEKHDEQGQAVQFDRPDNSGGWDA